MPTVRFRTRMGRHNTLRLLGKGGGGDLGTDLTVKFNPLKSRCLGCHECFLSITAPELAWPPF